MPAIIYTAVANWVLYFGFVVFRLFLCAVNISESIVSIISLGSRHYYSTTEQQTVLVQKFKYYNVDMSST